MANVPSYEESYWQSSASTPSFPVLAKDLEVDVVIVGGGIAGLTAAYLLKQSGLTVAVLEKNTIGSGTTSKTTGKLTSQHNIIYETLSARLGEKAARTYAEANQSAVEAVTQLIRRENIDCSFEIDDNYVYTTDPDKVSEFKSEAKTAAKLGLPASFLTKLELPFDVKAAVKFSGQAKFNAQKYVLGLAKLIDGGGSYVCERSNVTGFHDGTPAHVTTKGTKVMAKDIIVATKVPAAPLVARGACALWEHPHTSYIVAGKFPGSLKGMYISPDKNHYSILPVTDNGQKLLLIGGENHTPGLRYPRPRYQRLANYGQEHFGLGSIDYRWKGMDYLAYDDVPLIGKVYPWSKHLYMATGFMKWGLSTSMVAAIILRDTIQDQPNPWASTFNSMRIKPITSIPHTLFG
jgi:glycine/D-amino acid oxidase-like deaminating enzyme